jgi:hypothetical protein
LACIDEPEAIGSAACPEHDRIVRGVRDLDMALVLALLYCWYCEAPVSCK